MITYDTVWKNLCPCSPLNSRIFQIVTFTGGEKLLCSVNICQKRHVRMIESICYIRSIPVQSFQHTICATQLLSSMWYLLSKMSATEQSLIFRLKSDDVTWLQYVNKHILGWAAPLPRAKKMTGVPVIHRPFSEVRVMRGKVCLSVNTYLLNASGEGFFCFNFFFWGGGVFLSRLIQ